MSLETVLLALPTSAPVSVSGAPPGVSGAPPGPPDGALFHSALEDQSARTANAEGQQKSQEVSEREGGQAAPRRSLHEGRSDGIAAAAVAGAAMPTSTAAPTSRPAPPAGHSSTSASGPTAASAPAAASESTAASASTTTESATNAASTEAEASTSGEATAPAATTSNAVGTAVGNVAGETTAPAPAAAKAPRLWRSLTADCLQRARCASRSGYQRTQPARTAPVRGGSFPHRRVASSRQHRARRCRRKDRQRPRQCPASQQHRWLHVHVHVHVHIRGRSPDVTTIRPGKLHTGSSRREHRPRRCLRSSRQRTRRAIPAGAPGRNANHPHRGARRRPRLRIGHRPRANRQPGSGRWRKQSKRWAGRTQRISCRRAGGERDGHLLARQQHGASRGTNGCGRTATGKRCRGYRRSKPAHRRRRDDRTASRCRGHSSLHS